LKYYEVTYLCRHLLLDRWRLWVIVQGLPVLPRKDEVGLPKDEEFVAVEIAVRKKVGCRARALKKRT
jgi:hypothetical protein